MKLLSNSLKQAEFTRTVFTAKPEPGTTLDEMLAPEFWAHVAKTLKPGDRIEVTAGDNEWFAELMVRSTTANEAKVFLMRQVSFATPQAESGEVEIKHRGRAGWSVVRKSDKAIQFEGGETRADAEAFAATLG